MGMKRPLDAINLSLKPTISIVCRGVTWETVWQIVLDEIGCPLSPALLNKVLPKILAVHVWPSLVQVMQLLLTDLDGGGSVDNEENT